MNGRRQLLVIALVALLFGFTATDGRAQSELRLLTWEGYSHPSFTAAFEAESGCQVTSIMVGTNHDFPARLLMGIGEFDLASPSVDMTSVLAKLGVIEPVVKNWVWRFPQISDVFRNHPGIAFDGEIWGVPFAWSPVELLYRTDKVNTPLDSWEALWDPALAGKIALYDDKSSLYTVARMLYGPEADVFSLDDAELVAVKTKLVEQKPLLRTYWGSASELVSLFVHGDVWISDSWGPVHRTLTDQGLPVAKLVPKERANAWADAWQIVRGAKNLDCAYAWLNFALSPTAQCGLQAVTGYSGVNPVALGGCPETADQPSLNEDELSEFVFWREPERVVRYIDTWTAVKAAP